MACSKLRFSKMESATMSEMTESVGEILLRVMKMEVSRRMGLKLIYKGKVNRKWRTQGKRFS